MSLMRSANLNRVPRIALFFVLRIKDLCPVGKLDAVAIVVLAGLVNIALPTRKKKADVLRVEHGIGQVPTRVVHQVRDPVPHGDRERVAARELDGGEAQGEVSIVPLCSGLASA